MVLKIKCYAKNKCTLLLNKCSCVVLRDCTGLIWTCSAAIGHLFSIRKDELKQKLQQGQRVPLSHLELRVQFFTNRRDSRILSRSYRTVFSRLSQKMKSIQHMCSVQFIHRAFMWFLSLFTGFVALYISVSLPLLPPLSSATLNV